MNPADDDVRQGDDKPIDVTSADALVACDRGGDSKPSIRDVGRLLAIEPAWPPQQSILFEDGPGVSLGI